jgi:hypothetical protein
MVKLTKTKPLPIGVSIESRSDWGYGTPVRALLESDCHGKCYICEDKPKNTASLTVEHVVSRHSNPSLEYDWDNLLLACFFCNNSVKGHDFNGIINPSAEDPEEALSFGLSRDTRRVELTCLCADAKAAETKSLLDKAYLLNIKAFQKMIGDIRQFNYYINSWKAGDTSVTDYIRESVSRASAFSAFKRKIVRDDPQLRSQFAAFLT